MTVITLNNGLTAILEPTASRSAAACFYIKSGSRQDPDGCQGAAHFLEHMAFKGSARHSADELLVAFDELGDETNAQTSQDYTCYHGWVRPDDISRLIELLAELLRPVLPLDEFTTEKGVVLEEIAMETDDLEVSTFDAALEHAYQGHPLSGRILGTNESVARTTRDDLAAYGERYYAPTNLIVAVSGRFDADETMRAIRAASGEWPAGTAVNIDAPVVHTGEKRIESDQFERTGLCASFDAPGCESEWADAAEVLSMILGDEDNSRLYWQLVQEGLVDEIEAGHYALAGTGLFYIQTAAEPANVGEVMDVIRRACETICAEAPSSDEVDRARNKMKTTFALDAELPSERAWQLADDYANLGRTRTPEERMANLDRVTPQAIADYLRRYPINGAGSWICLGRRP